MVPTPLVECTDETWDRQIRINLTSLFYICRAAARIMISQKSGAIINVTSITGRTGGGGGTIPYSAAKGGMNAFTRGLARELAQHGIRVNGIAPGMVDTPMLNTHASKERLEAFRNMVPLKRKGTPEEMVEPVLLLAGDGGSYITGEIIEVNGGLLMD